MLHIEPKTIKEAVDEELLNVGGEEAAAVFDALTGNFIRLAAKISQQVMTNEQERDYVTEKEEQLKIIQRVVILL